jgi:cohesin loading factor subunit SCC2
VSFAKALIRLINKTVSCLFRTLILNVVRYILYSSIISDAKEPVPTNKKRKVSISPPSEVKSPTMNATSPLSKYLKRIYKLILSSSLVASFSNLMETLETYIYNVPLDPSPLLQIASVCLYTMDIVLNDISNITDMRLIQYGCMSVLTRIFGTYKSIRRAILDDFLGVLKHIPYGKKSGRTFVLNTGSRRFIINNSVAVSNDTDTNGDNVMVHNVSVLICDMIQSCALRHRETVMYDGNIENQHGEVMNNTAIQSTAQVTPTHDNASVAPINIQDSMAVCILFTKMLLQRCSRKGEEGGASEYRPVLQNLVQDCLKIQLLPEYPAAELLLLSITKHICEDLMGCRSINAASTNINLEPTYLATAMDTLGLISSDICAKVAAAKANPLVFPKAINLTGLDSVCKDPSNSESEKNRCFCGREAYNDTDMLDCDRCHHWFHMSCVGVAKDNLPDSYICDECKMQMLVIHQMEALMTKAKKMDQIKADLPSEPGHEDKVHIMRTLLLKFLSHQVRTTKNISLEAARDFYLAKCIQDIQDIQISRDANNGFLSHKMMQDHLLQLWNHYELDFHTTVGKNSMTNCEGTLLYEKCEYLSQEGNSKLMLTLIASKSSLVSMFPYIIGVIVTLMGDEGLVTLRKLSVKALSQIVFVEPNIMSKTQIRDAVSARCQDSAISVRDAAVSLVGVYVQQIPELAEVYQDSLLARLSDKGVSVKKRVVKIFKDLIATNPLFSGRARVFTKFLEQSSDRKEDDGVRDLIYEAFVELWFSRNEARGKMDRNDSAMETARQMVEVVALSSSPKHLSYLVREIVHGKGGKKETKMLSQRKIGASFAEKYCMNIVSTLIEDLVAFEGRDKDHARGSDHDGRALIALLTTLRTFADVHPPLLRQYYDPLLPYLKANNNVPRKYEEQIVFNICKILSNVSKILTDAEVHRLGHTDLPTDLVSITKIFPPSAASAAVETLASISIREEPDTNGHTTCQLMNLAKLFYSYLLKAKDTTNNFSKREKNNIYRALNVLGCICRYANREEDCILDNIEEYEAIDSSLITWENLSSSSFALFQVYLSMTDVTLKCKALRAISSIFVTHPRIMLVFEERGVLSEIMGEESDPSLQLEALKCWREILIDEETRVESGEAKRQMDSKETITISKKVSGDQDGDASLIGACCIQHSQRLFSMTSNTDVNIRLNALLLIETLLRQGQLNPMKAIPYLFALMGDIWTPIIQETSVKLLMDECERRPELVRQLFCEGIRSSFFFQNKVYKGFYTPTVLIMDKTEKNQRQCIFDQIYVEVIRSSRAYSTRVIKYLFSLFDGHKNGRGQSKEKYFSKSLTLLSFASEVLAYLPYNHLGDVLCILHTISSIVDLRGSDILSKLSEFLFSVGITNQKDGLNKRDIVEKAASKKYPSKCNGLEALRNPDFDSENFIELCAEASSLTLLLRVGAFLRSSYAGATVARLSEYHPGEKERPSDRGVARLSNGASLFSSQICGSGMKDCLDIDCAIRQYAEFCEMMREE